MLFAYSEVLLISKHSARGSFLSDFPFLQLSESSWGMLGSSGKGMLICLFFFIQTPTQGCAGRGLHQTHAVPDLSYLIYSILIWFPNTGSIIFLEVHTHKKKESPFKSTYMHIFFNLRGSKWISAYTDTVISRDLLPLSCCMHWGYPLKLNWTGILPPFSWCISVSSQDTGWICIKGRVIQVEQVASIIHKPHIKSWKPIGYICKI